MSSQENSFTDVCYYKTSHMRHDGVKLRSDGFLISIIRRV